MVTAYIMGPLKQDWITPTQMIVMDELSHTTTRFTDTAYIGLV